jgi:hypothetical protein
MTQLRSNSERKRAILERVKEVLKEDEWELKTLRERKDSKGITEAI